MRKEPIADRPQLAVRDPRVPIILFAVGTIVLLWWDLPKFYLSATMTAIPIELHPLEYLPVAVGIMLSIYFAPRFRTWEQLGTRRNSVQAIISTLTTIVVPFAMSLLAAIRFPVTTQDPKLLSTNVLIICALASLLVGVLGRLWGLILFIATYYGSIVFAAELPDQAHWGLRTLFTVGVETYSTIQWPWIIVLITFALLYAWFRRSIPIIHHP
ncbi:hypothetical protein VRY54_04590 [Actinomyces sp. F1_1611]